MRFLYGFNKMLLIFLLTALGFEARVRVKHTHHKHKKTKFECLNGKDPSTLSRKEILAEFSKGNCAPIILVPGIMSTKLIIQVKDCGKLQTDFPELFNLCGFTHCSKLPHETLKIVPVAEYPLWIPAIVSPLSIFTYKESANYCFAKFLKQNIDFSKPIEDSVVENEAFAIRVHGNTETTKNDFKCGDGATQNLLPLGARLQTKETQAFVNMHKTLKEMGFVAGLTYQTLPYNFLKSYRASELNQSFEESLTRLYQLSNKKVVILGHSMGNMNIKHQLDKLSTLQKDTMVKIWLAAGPPFLGSIKMQKTLISGNDDFTYLRSLIGLKLKPGIEGMNNIQTAYVLIAKDPFTLYKGQPWFEAVGNRTKYEDNKLGYNQSGFNFLPETSESCSPKAFNTYFPNCTLGLYDTSEQPYVQILSETFKLSETQKLFEKWNTTENAIRFLNHNHDEEYLKFDNPGVPMVLLMLRTSPTLRTLTYNVNITQFIAQNVFYYPATQTYYGDGTVPAYSQVIPVLKWAWEFENRTVKQAKPVKIIDFCSNYKQRTSPYDINYSKKGRDVTNNEFFGINCECMAKSSPANCGHATLVGDQYFLEMLTNLVLTEEQGLTPSHANFIQQLEEAYLDKITIECPTVRF